MENCNARVPTAAENDVLPFERRQSERRAEAREVGVTQALAALLDGYRLKKREFPTYSELHALCVAAPVAAGNNPHGLVNPPSRAEPASQHMNTYRIPFMLKCPNNNHVVRYGLSIESADTIMVEDIIAAVEALPAEGFQEDIAAQLAQALPGSHTIIAHHHGVDIETRRGLAA